MPTSSALRRVLLPHLAGASRFHQILPFSHSTLLPRDNYALATAAKSAGVTYDLHSGKKIHSLALKLGFESDVVLTNSVMGMYFACGDGKSARKVFDEMPKRSVVSWNTLIAQLHRLGLSGEVWDLVRRMGEEGTGFDGFTISTVLQACGTEWDGRVVHGFAARNGLDLDFHVGSGLIDMYCRCRSVGLGRRVFDGMEVKNVVHWTAMIGGYVQNGEFQEGLSLFGMMMQVKRDDGVIVVGPNKVTLLCVLSAVGSLASLGHGKEVHGFALKGGFYGEVSLNNSLIDMYVKCGSLDWAARVFIDGSWEKDSISWGSMVCGYGLHGKGEDAVALFDQMCNVEMKLDPITCVGVISACGRSGLVNKGFQIYNSLVQNHQIVPTLELCSCVVDMFCRAGQLSRALDFIKSMPMDPGSSVWGAVISFAVAQGNREVQDLAYSLLSELEPHNPSNDVMVSNSLACSGKWDVVMGLRRRMKSGGLQKMAGISWLSVNNTVNSFFVADKRHRNANLIYEILDHLLAEMRGTDHVPNIKVCE